MIVQLGALLAATLAVYTIRKISVQKSYDPVKPPKKDEVPVEMYGNDGEIVPEEEEFEDFEVGEEKEEVKSISNVVSSAGSEDEVLAEFESLLSREIDFSLPADKFDASANMAYEHEMGNNASEVERLRNLVKELEAREVKLEHELLEYYGLKEQESSIVELQKQLQVKTEEIDMLHVTINSLQAERKKLKDEVFECATAKKELEKARMRIKELQEQIQLEVGQTKGQLLLLKQQVSALQAKEQKAVLKDEEVEKKLKTVKDLEEELIELKKNRELQHEKRELIARLEAAESNIKMLSTIPETEMVAKAREQLVALRHKNEDLCKQVEGLQMNSFAEVEELVYLRWVNARLRYELQNYQTPSGRIPARDLERSLSPRSGEKAKHLLLEYVLSERGHTDTESNFDNTSIDSEEMDSTSTDSSVSRVSRNKKPSFLQKLKRLGKRKDTSGSSARPVAGSLEGLILRNAGDGMAITSVGASENDDLNSLETLKSDQTQVQDLPSDGLHSIAASFQLMSKSVELVVEEKYLASKDRHKLASEREKKIREKAEHARAVKYVDPVGGDGKPVSLSPKLALMKEKPDLSGNSNDSSNENTMISPIMSKMHLPQIEKRAPRVPRPPPKPSAGASSASVNTNAPNRELLLTPPPGGGPPPPAPGSLSKGTGGSDKVHRAPELVAFYQVLIKREAKKEDSSLISLSSNTLDARSNMISEMANRSSFLLAVKADVETQADFIISLAAEVRASSFTDMDDLVAFVNWLDEELSFLVDERAVLMHFDWPEGKTDALREAAFEYQDLMKLEKLVSSFVDDPNLPCDAAFKEMYTLLEKVEESVYALLRTRDIAVSRYKEFCIPVDWLQDCGVLGTIKLSSVKLAQKYMKRVATELDAMNEPEKEPIRELLILQGVRFAFRVHQFAGGFDAESMKAFEELRSRVCTQATRDQNTQKGS